MGSCFWQDNETFINDGIQIEPFNLAKEREEGYFDESGNYVEYMNENEIKVLGLTLCKTYPLVVKFAINQFDFLQDAWLDNVEVDPKLAEKGFVETINEDGVELSAQEIGMMKRRMADVLEPGETVSFYFCQRCVLLLNLY